MSISKSLRNRIVGLLVIVSLIMIIVPAMMDPRQVYTQDENAIAVNDQGAVVDNKGQLVSPSEHDYTDLLAPEDDTLASVNNGAPSVNNVTPLVTTTPPATSNEDLEVPDDNMFGPAPTIVDAQPLNSQNANATVTESLPSVSDKSKTENTQTTTQTASNNKKNETTSVNSQTKPQTNTQKNQPQTKGDFALQVGVFSNKQNADSVLARLKMSGYKPVTQVINVNGKQAIRIYAGFASTRDAAKAMAADVQKRTGFKCNVVNHQEIDDANT